jgi:hypothetical protein
VSQAYSSHACSGGFNSRAIRRNATALRSANGLHLAAAPTFAIMALLTCVLGDASPMCGVASPLSGMVPMYLLMSAFHLPPWLKLIGSWRGRPTQPRSNIKIPGDKI